jgi:CO/xanthine dehydrogenase Mo-binding subunit
MTGGAVKTACEAVRAVVFERLAAVRGRDYDDLSLIGGKIVSVSEGVIATLEEVLAAGPIEETREYHHHQTQRMDPFTGQGNSHTQLAFAVHRAVVDVDTELGLIKVVALDLVQDVGKIMNRLSLEGQLHGGSAQGLGLAVMEEIVITDGRIRNPSFTDYLLPTSLDAPEVVAALVEEPDPQAPLGAKGVGEPPCISVTPAIVAAIRQAAGRDITRVPVRPQDICLD